MLTWEGTQLRVAVFSHPSGPWDQTQVFRVGSGCPLIPLPSPGQTVLAGAAPLTLFLVTAGNGRHWSWPLLFISGHQVCGRGGRTDTSVVKCPHHTLLPQLFSFSPVHGSHCPYPFSPLGPLLSL